jgi:hypothetical protein
MKFREEKLLLNISVMDNPDQLDMTRDFSVNIND